MSALRHGPNNGAMIVVDNICKSFGGYKAVDQVSLNIGHGTITGLIGPNGAGKTTLFNVVAGELAPTSGDVYLDGIRITGMPPHELFKRGFLRTFQIAQEFPSMTVRENLMMVPGGSIGRDPVEFLVPSKRLFQAGTANLRTGR